MTFDEVMRELLETKDANLVCMSQVRRLLVMEALQFNGDPVVNLSTPVELKDGDEIIIGVNTKRRWKRINDKWEQQMPFHERNV